MSFAMSAFVFLFLLVFRPFGLSEQEHVLLITFGFGATCLLVMLFLNVIIIASLPVFFDEDNWFIWKELVWVLINIALVGLANAFYTSRVAELPFNLQNVGTFELYTLAVSVLPLIVSVLINYSLKKERFEKTSNEISKGLLSRSKPRKEATVVLDGGSERLELQPDDFLYAKSLDNYIECYYLIGAELKKCLLRKTLKSTSEDFATVDDIRQVHRSYLVNLNHVSHVSGNAQGLRLHFELTEEIVPVSRNLTESLRAYFAVDHSSIPSAN